MTNRWITPIVLALMATFVLGASSATRAGEFLFIDDFEDTATLTGRVLDTNVFVDQGVELPIEGVEVTLLGVPGSAVTGSNGEFILRNVPAGEQVLDLDTSLAVPAPTGDAYAGFRERILLDGFEYVLRPFYLPRIDASSLTTIDPTQTTVVENPNLGIEMTVVAGSAMAENGSLFDGQLSISEVPGGLAPAALPDFLEPGLLVTIQPVGVTFDPPAPITFPNFDNLPPGSGTDLWSLDPETGQFVVVGTGEVSADGQRVETVSGGIVAADWHAPPPPPPREGDGDDDGPPRCNGCCPSCAGAVGSSVDLFNGEFSETVRLPGIVSMSREFAPEFVYTSRRAFPLAVIPVNSAIVSRAATPNLISYRGFIDGELVQDEVFIDTSTLPPRGPVGPPADEPFRVAVPFDNTARATGIYDADVMVTSVYERSRISAVNPTPLGVVNEIDGPFGAGWSLAGLDRLVLDAPGTIRERLLLVEGDGGSIQFEEQLTGVNPDGIITIVIPQNTSTFWPTETNAMIAILDDMGLPSQLVVGTEFTEEVLDQSRMVIFMDFTFRHNADSPVIQQIADVMKIAQDNGVPTYYVGQEPAFLNNPGAAPDFMEIWLGLWNLQIASSTNGGQGVVTATDPTHPIFDGPAGSLTQFNISGDVDVTRGSNTGETTIAESAMADIVLVEESAAGGRNVTMNTTIAVNQPTADRDELALIVRNTVTWLLQSPSLASGFFGEGEFAAVDGDYSGVVRDPGTGTFTRVLRDGAVHLFNADGLMTSAVDLNGNATAYAYDAQDRLQTITDPAGRVTTFAYDGNGRLDSVTDPAGRVTDFTVDAAGNLTGVTFPDGATRGFGYDARHLMTSQTDPRGFTTQYQYDDFGFFTQSTQPDGSVRQVSPAQKIGLVDTSGGLGSEGNPAPIVRPETALSGFVDPEGRTLTAATGRFGEPVDVAGPDGLITSVSRDADGNPTSVILGSGAEFQSTYDTLGNLRSWSDQNVGSTFTFDYHPEFNTVTRITESSGATTTLAYDTHGNLISLTTPMNRVNAADYLPNGLLNSQTDRFGTVTSIGYDAQGLITQVGKGSGPNARVTQFGRSPDGRVTSIQDPESGTTQLTYDDMGRIVDITRPDSETTFIGWNPDGSLAELTPPGRSPHSFTYSNNGLLASYQPPNVAGPTPTAFRYNLAGKRTGIDFPDGRSIDYAYDAAGRLSSLETARGVRTYGYNSGTGLLANITQPDGQGLTFTQSGGIWLGQSWSGVITGQVARTFNTSGRLASETVNGQDPIAFSYDLDGLIVQSGDLAFSRDAASGVVVGTSLDQLDDVRSYNEFGELIDYQSDFAGAPLYSYLLERDKLGRITRKTETIQGITTVHDYFYDLRGRLERVEQGGSVIVEYTWDANGNRLSRVEGMTSETGVYDAQDRATSYGQQTFTYRQNGQLLGRTDGTGTTTYDYDELGNLITVQLAGGTEVSYIVDGVDRRVGKRINGALVAGWLYRDGLNPIAELDTAGNVVARFVYGSPLHVPVYMIKNGATYRIFSDHLGSVRLVVDASTGVIAQRLDYDEFGRIITDTNPGFQPFGFAGGLYDPDTGLVRFGARDYDPRTGRWTAKDPAGFSGGQTNLYQYVGGDPVNAFDPSGLRESNSASDNIGLLGTTLSVVSLSPGLPGEAATILGVLASGSDLTSRAVAADAPPPVGAEKARQNIGYVSTGLGITGLFVSASAAPLVGSAAVGLDIGNRLAPAFYPIADRIGNPDLPPENPGLQDAVNEFSAREFRGCKL